MTRGHELPVHWHAWIQRHGQDQPDAIALLGAGREPLRFGELLAQFERTGAALGQQGLTRSSRVALLLPQGVDAASALLSVMAHAVCVPLNPSMPTAELEAVLRAAGAHALVLPTEGAQALTATAAAMGLAVLGLQAHPGCAGRFELEALAPLRLPSASHAHSPDGAVIHPEQPALVLHTSGTTGDAKRVLLSHRQLGASARNIALHLQIQPSDRSLNVMPLFHSHGIVGVLLSSLVSGASVACLESFEPQRFCDAVAEFRPTWYSASPTIHVSVLEHVQAYRQRAAQHRFRFVRSTSAALPAALLERLEAALEAPVIESFGMTEWSQMASNALPPGLRRAGSVGHATGVELALRQAHGEVRLLSDARGAVVEGELIVRGEGVAGAYDGDPAATAQAWIDGWFRTGDLARIDEQGFLSITGRLKDVVNRGGEKLAPLEIEAALMTHPDVLDAVAFGVPHPTLGEDLAAAAVLKTGAVATEVELRSHLFARLAAFKVPTTVTLTDTIPRSAIGKIQRRGLAQRFQASESRVSAAPQSPIEQDLHGIFCGVLGRETIGLDDNFFALGGDSLSGMRVISRINKQQGVRLPPASLFRHPSIRALAMQIRPVPTPAEAVDVASQIAGLSDEEVHRLLALEEAAAARRVA
jgi:acyl-CoA synthetase (AMP-forming)/AMP-acid ligase II/acyl carrier protein